MRIGIIGAGQIGGTLARRLTALGHEVAIANSRGPETLRELAKETGARPVTVKEAARAGEVVIVTIPMRNIPRLPHDLFAGVPADVVVVDTNNYYPQQRDGRIAALEDGTPESVWVAELLGAPVYKVFNGIWWKHLLESGTPSGTPNRIALPVAGEDGPNRSVVHDIVDQLGFEPVDAGPISESWRQQPGTPVYGKDFDADNTRKALAEATPQRTAEWSARSA
jgi:predicted dinucleotide-binding enzyme